MGIFFWFLGGGIFVKLLGHSFFLMSFSLFFLFCFCWSFSRVFMFLHYDLLGLCLASLMVMIFLLIYLILSQNMFSGMKFTWVSFSFFVLVFFLYFAFGVINWFLLYFVFECCILPTFFVILGWGLGEGRVQASFYFFFYTMFFSLPFLIFLFLADLSLGSCFMGFHYYVFLPNFWVFLGVLSFLIFLAKLPVFFFHLWLPSAHVEAPLAGSMVLAGVLLKLGGYGFVRLIQGYVSILLDYFTFMYVLGVLGGIYSGFSCFRQVDLKRMVAFMSVSHMSMMLSGLLSMTYLGLYGCLMFMVSHGLTSSGLFGCVTYYYTSRGTRSIVILRGGIGFFSSFTLFFFLLCLLNLSFPPTLGFFSELFVLWGVIFYWCGVLALLFILIFLGCLGTIHLYVSMTHGLGLGGESGEDLSVKFVLYFFIHFIPALLIFFVFF